ncbi:MAG: FAD-dependent oxidoreductase [Sphingopyxis sp.]|nr:FAD-dependent oxidoreductase [Sphingopyxis sp.]MCW0198172.1 FAD-dependent oxidoreductase [Sphingopyxis sp.]
MAPASASASCSQPRASNDPIRLPLFERSSHSWAGLRTFTHDRVPVAGFAPDAEGFFWLAGQGGYGLQTAPAMAAATEALITGGDWPADLADWGVDQAGLAVERLQRRHRDHPPPDRPPSPVQ